MNTKKNLYLKYIFFISSFLLSQLQYGQVHKCNDFIESIGVATHFNYTDIAYVTRYNEVKQILGNSGIRYIRDGAAVYNTNSANRVKQLYEDYGIKCIVLFANKYFGHDYINTRLKEFALSSDYILAFEGANEPDMDQLGYNIPNNWTDKLRAEQAFLLNAVKNHTDSAIRLKPVLAPSHTFPNRVSWMGEMKSLSDFYNIHSYHGGINPESTISNFSKYLVELPKVNNDPDFITRTWCTEAGYHNELVLKQNGCTPEVEAKYLNRMFLWYFKNGIKRTVNYELIDGLYKDNNQRNFGLLDKNLQPKPAFTALKNFISILNDTTSNFETKDISYTLENKLKDTYDMLFQHSNGDYYLALWQGVLGWSPPLKQVVNVNPINIKLTLPGKAAKIAVFNPLVSEDSINSFTNTQTLDISVPDEVIILNIKGLDILNSKKNTNKDKIRIHFNPYQKILEVYGVESDFKYNIFTTSGSLAKQGLMLNSNAIDMSGLMSGVYFVNIFVDDNMVTKKLIIQ